MTAKPVTLPPGREMLCTSPSATGSPEPMKMTGIVLVSWSSRVCGRVAIGQQHIRRKPQRPLGRSLHPGCVARAPLKIDLKVTADAPAGLFELPAECVGAKLPLRIVLGIEDDDADPPLRLLRTRAKRVSGRTACEQQDEFASPHGSPQGYRQGCKHRAWRFIPMRATSA